MSGTAGGAVRDAARRFLARHYRVMASAVNVGDWQAYIRVCAAAQEDGTAWFDDEALAEPLSVVADTTAGEAEIERAARLLYPGHFPDYALRLHPEQILRVASALAARSGGAQDDGELAAIAAALRDEGPFPRTEVGDNVHNLRGRAETAEHILAGLRARIEALIAFYDRHEYSSLEVDDLRRALAGPDDARQDGAR